MEKLLESAALKLSSVISDLNGESGRRMIEALIAGERDPDVLAGLGHGLLKASQAELAEVLTGRFSEHHGFLAKLHPDLIDSYTARIADLAARIETYFEPDRPAPGHGPSLHRARELLVTIPGISMIGAEQILAEIGTDMTVFASPGRLASWAGLAPGAHESAGKIKSTRCRPGNSYLKGTLGIVAMTAARQKRSFPLRPLPAGQGSSWPQSRAGRFGAHHLGTLLAPVDNRPALSRPTAAPTTTTNGDRAPRSRRRCSDSATPAARSRPTRKGSSSRLPESPATQLSGLGGQDFRVRLSGESVEMAARRSLGRRRGLPKMEVLTLTITEDLDVARRYRCGLRSP